MSWLSKLLGGGSKPVANPMQDARARVWELQQKTALDEKTRIAQEERARLAAEGQRNEFNSKVGDAYGKGLDYAKYRVNERGLNYADFADPIAKEFEHQRSLIPSNDSNPASYFGDDLIDRALGRVRDSRRTQYGQQADQFAGNDFATKAVGDNFDDSALNNVYNEQYGDASDQLQRAFARGNLSPIGMSLAKQKLESQGKAGMSRLQDLGGGVLGKYRSELGDIGKAAHGAASSYDLGGTFDAGGYQRQIADKQGQFGQRLEGDVRDATKGEQLFNVDDIVGKAGVSQGLYNPATANSNTNINSSPIMDALGARKKRNTNSSAGAF